MKETNAILAVLGIIVVLAAISFLITSQEQKSIEPQTYSLNENKISVSEKTNYAEKEFEFNFDEPKYIVLVVSNENTKISFNAEELEKKSDKAYIINSLSNPLKFSVQFNSNEVLIEAIPIEREFYYALSNENQNELISLLQKVDLRDKEKINEIKNTFFE